MTRRAGKKQTLLFSNKPSMMHANEDQESGPYPLKTQTLR